MLTSYLVKCPHAGCDWFGSLLPRENTDSWYGAVPSVPEAVFECPQCRRRWHARVRGDDLETVSLEESAGALT
jgi:hypothetical protein